MKTRRSVIYTDYDSPRGHKKSVNGLQQGLDGQLAPLKNQPVAVLRHPVGVTRLIKGKGHAKGWHTVVLGLLQPQVATMGDEEPCIAVSYSIKEPCEDK